MLGRLQAPSLHGLTPFIHSVILSVPRRYGKMAYSVTAQPGPSIPSFINKFPSLAISESEDDANIRHKYRPFLLDDGASDDWVNKLELTIAMEMAAQELRQSNNRLKVLVLYGSLRQRSYSRLVALEASRILFRLGCDVRVFNPDGLPVKNDTDHDHPKVQELRDLSKWSDGHVWISPEQHGNLVGIPSLTSYYFNY